MVEFETLGSTEIQLASKDKITIASKLAVSEDRQTEFISISKSDSNGRIKQTLTLPMDTEVVRVFIDALESVV